ncbi:MAG: protocatechuate 3,4-dioxygenase [Fuerstiella sp.]
MSGNINAATPNSLPSGGSVPAAGGERENRPQGRGFSRRHMIKKASFAAACFSTAGLFAEELLRTPALTEGPFYPDKLPLDTDNDLLLLNDATTPAIGEVTYLSGRILNAAGQPVRNAFVEIWQCDANGAYLHSGTGNADKRDNNFQGYGRFLTDARGRYFFRTIKPVPYPGRTPHIHFGISHHGQRVLTTQMLINGHPQNDRDGVFRQVTDVLARETILVDFQPLPDSKLGELAANFDIVLGKTAQETEDGTLISPLARPAGGGSGRNRSPRP